MEYYQKETGIADTKYLGLALSSRKNLCLNEEVGDNELGYVFHVIHDNFRLSATAKMERQWMQIAVPKLLRGSAPRTTTNRTAPSSMFA